MVAGGDALLAPTATRRLIQAFVRHAPPESAPELMSMSALGRLQALLTVRELEVLTLIAAGLNNPEIAEHLTLSAGTVKTHISHLLAKLDARDRVQLVLQAFRAGLAQGRAGLRS